MSQHLTILGDPRRIRSHDYHREEEKQSTTAVTLPTVSIIIPTYNESKNIVQVIESIRSTLGDRFSAEVIVVDDNSPDGTANLVDIFAKKEEEEEGGGMNTEINSIQIIRRQGKRGLSSAIVDGILCSSSDIAVVMDADFSHTPVLLPEMITQFIQRKEEEVDLVIASRYVEDGRIEGWGVKRRLVSLGATKIAQYGFGIKEVKDPISGFFAVRRSAIKDIKFDAIGYKILLEILLKAKLRTIIELPYIFKDRTEGSSKLDSQTIIQYLKACRKLHSYKQEQEHGRRRPPVEISQVQKGSGLSRFVNKAEKFYLIGALGLLVNYGSSFLLSHLLFGMYYMHATVLGIGLSIVSNFLLNKVWTFNDRDFTVQRVIRQGLWFVLSSMMGVAIQVCLIYYFVQYVHLEYIVALGLAVLFASSTNFLAAKKLAFKERIMT